MNERIKYASQKKPKKREKRKVASPGGLEPKATVAVETFATAPKQDGRPPPRPASSEVYSDSNSLRNTASLTEPKRPGETGFFHASSLKAVSRRRKGPGCAGQRFPARLIWPLYSLVMAGANGNQSDLGPEEVG